MKYMKMPTLRQDNIKRSEWVYGNKYGYARPLRGRWGKNKLIGMAMAASPKGQAKEINIMYEVTRARVEIATA